MGVGLHAPGAVGEAAVVEEAGVREEVPPAVVLGPGVLVGGGGVRADPNNPLKVILN